MTGPPAHSYPEPETSWSDACRASLDRSRARRAAAARERARRRRARSGSGALTFALSALALSAPLSLAHSTPAGHSTTLLTAGSSGSDVMALQRALGVSPTGNYGPITRRAVLAFQRSHGLVVDGIVGPQTSAALGLSSAPASPTTTAAKSASAPSATLQRIAACESGGNPRAVSAGGEYRGKYQFSRATWRAMGGTGDPAAAPEATQDRMAAQLLARSGTTPWPTCG